MLKAAAVKQVWQLAAPHHEFPNSTASALRDMELKDSRLTEKRGTLGGTPKKEKTSLAAAKAAGAKRGKLGPC